jgi:hypothetical protein
MRNDRRACSMLHAFDNQVQAQSGKRLTISQANLLLASSEADREAIGCR